MSTWQPMLQPYSGSRPDCASSSRTRLCMLCSAFSARVDRDAAALLRPSLSLPHPTTNRPALHADRRAVTSLWSVPFFGLRIFPPRARPRYLSPSVRTHARMPACVLVRILPPSRACTHAGDAGGYCPPHTRTRGRCVAKLPHACVGARAMRFAKYPARSQPAEFSAG